MDAEVETAGSGPSKRTRPKTADELILRGDRARDARDWAVARSSYEQALQLNPVRGPIWIQLGHAAKESSDYAAAEHAYRKALELNPKDADAHLQLGHLMKITKRLAEAGIFYTEALALNPQLLDARREIKALRAQLSTAASSGPFGELGTTMPGLTSLVFEVSDLMTYFQTSRLPTGIQRVQMEVIRALSDDESSAPDYAIVCFVQERGFWVEVPRSLFNRFCLAAIAGGDASAEDWNLLLESLTVIRTTAPLFAFPQGSILLDLGTSWWQRNYFLNLRVAKAASHIRYVPFIHDLIPIITPEHCAAELRRDFLTWIAGVFHHADHFFVNSNATRTDLQMVAKELGRSPGEIAIVTLAADFRRPIDNHASVGAVEDARDLLASHGLAKGNYVLCVATIESRKNHAAAFAVWLRMIKKYGARNVPKLVCVGKDGWLNDSVYHTLSASELLSNQVMILQNISDASLGALYANCLFSLYPSFYEGWGLPVTEALCYGKVPVTTKASSLPEAGGEFAEYFEIGSENEFLARIERLTYDNEYRTAREQKIANEFKPRSWADISAQIVAQLQQWAEAAADEPPATESPAQAPLGVLHSLARGTDAILWKGLESGEIYRHGRAWWFTEDWGCWTTGKHPAFLAFTLAQVAEAEVLVYLALRGTPGSETVCTVRSEGVPPIEVDLAPDQDQIVVLELPAAPEATRQIAISLSSSTAVNLSAITEGMDNRIVGPGVRWFYACKKDDILARVSMAEALSIGDFRRLIRRPPHGPDYFIHT
jgi:glycosyltransferase involved in cell wall biosynthesis